MAYVDEKGVLKAQHLLPEKAHIQKREVMKQFLIDNIPGLIVLNSTGGWNAKQTAEMVQNQLVKEVEDVLRNR
jgi:hypothetical protein